MMQKYLNPLFAALVFFGCNSKPQVAQTEMKEQTNAFSPIGNYVSESYERRSEGYDWVGVSVTQINDSALKISVRSRADKKKPTCTFDATAAKINDTTYSAPAEGKTVLFVFRDSSLVISTRLKEDEGILYYYCSGGGSLADTYQKIYEPLDEKQIDPSIFKKTPFSCS